MAEDRRGSSPTRFCRADILFVPGMMGTPGNIIQIDQILAGDPRDLSDRLLVEAHFAHYAGLENDARDRAGHALIQSTAYESTAEDISMEDCDAAPFPAPPPTKP